MTGFYITRKVKRMSFQDILNRMSCCWSFRLYMYSVKSNLSHPCSLGSITWVSHDQRWVSFLTIRKAKLLNLHLLA